MLAVRCGKEDTKSAKLCFDFCLYFRVKMGKPVREMLPS